MSDEGQVFGTGISLRSLYGASVEYPAALDDVCKTVSKFWFKFGNGLQWPQLTLIYDDSWSDQFYRKRNKRIRWTEKWGVYLYFAQLAGELLYIGKTTNKDARSMDKECWQIQRRSDIRPKRRWVYAFLLDRKTNCEHIVIPLETCLIYQFRPPYNLVVKPFEALG